MANWLFKAKNMGKTQRIQSQQLAGPQPIAEGVGATSLLFGTFKEANPEDNQRDLPLGWEGGPIDPPMAATPTGLRSGNAAMQAANYGTEGGEVRYNWKPIFWQPYVPNPQKQMYTPTPPGSFPWIARLGPQTKDRTNQRIASIHGQARRAIFTPPDTAEVYAFD